MTKPREAKYRPVLTATQITYILHLAKTEVPLSNESFSIISTLAPFQAKIEAEAIQPSYTLKPEPPSLLESLGELQPRDKPYDDAIGVPQVPPANSISKEEIWALAYAKYKLSPDSCTVQELRDAQEHRYLNDLMTQEEIKQFENKDGEFNL